ncbi:MAG: DNA gyrase subunit A, partial [Chloroflexota bacterium]
MEVGRVRRIDIDDEMQQAYLDYAMSVIVARALPDARDGLKPVHRRILYAMYDMGIRPEAEFRKSARIVGEVLGKYHPHGDMAVYDAMARMAQDFSMRFPLTDGQGNFGSVDGDAPAAMRYTEARLTPLAMEMLTDIDKDTVDLTDNFDGSLREPTVLPAGFPNLLANGATGIAVGMATSIPPHNMGEICDALVHMLENWTHQEKIGVEELMEFIQGPDFPTGGIIVRQPGEAEGLAAAYGTGRGRISVQARAHIEDMGRGRSRIIVTELPYQTNKAGLIERIAELARMGALEGLADLRDESDRQGMRIVIELTKAAEPEKILAELYKRTPMQSTFSIIMLALVDGEPRLLTLKQALRVYLEHRLDVVRRRSQFDLQRARERAHILEGLRTALTHLDEVVQLIRAARDADQARERLMRRYKLSEIQANAILDMPLRRLASLERKRIEQEYREKVALIAELESLLASERKLRAVVSHEIVRIKDQYSDRRRTQIVHLGKGKRVQALLTAGDLADLTPEKETWVVVTRDGRISRTPSGRLPRLAGRDAPTLVLGASARDTLYLFDGRGLGAAIAVHRLPECDDPAQGSPVAGTTPLPPEAEAVAGVTLPPGRVGGGAPEGYLVFCTRQGMIKKTILEALPGPSGRTFSAIHVAEGDALAWVRMSSGGDEVMLVSSAGAAIRFSEQEVRPTGPGASGVMGIRLEPDAQVVGMAVVDPGGEVLVVTTDGKGKRVSGKDFPVQGRNGKGVLAWRSGESPLAGTVVGQAEDRAVVHLARAPARSIRLGDAPRRTRAASGKPLLEVKGNDRVVGLFPVLPRPALPQVGEAPEPPRKPKRAAAKTGGEAKAEEAAGKPQR